MIRSAFQKEEQTALQALCSRNSRQILHLWVSGLESICLPFEGQVTMDESCILSELIFRQEHSKHTPTAIGNDRFLRSVEGSCEARVGDSGSAWRKTKRALTKEKFRGRVSRVSAICTWRISTCLRTYCQAEKQILEIH